MQVLFSNPIFVRMLLSLCVEAKENVNYWLSPPVFFDNLLVNYYRVGLEKSQVDAIDAHAYKFLENDLVHYIFDSTILAMEGKFINLPIFTHLQEFIEKNTIFNDLNAGSFGTSFRALLLSELLVFLVFLLQSYGRLTKQRRVYRRWKRRYRRRLVRFRI